MVVTTQQFQGFFSLQSETMNQGTSHLEGLVVAPLPGGGRGTLFQITAGLRL